jgi:hypothetical protein
VSILDLIIETLLETDYGVLGVGVLLMIAMIILFFKGENS